MAFFFCVDNLIGDVLVFQFQLFKKLMDGAGHLHGNTISRHRIDNK